MAYLVQETAAKGSGELASISQIIEVVAIPVPVPKRDLTTAAKFQLAANSAEDVGTIITELVAATLGLAEVAVVTFSDRTVRPRYQYLVVKK